jgi:hypothetical protein
VSLDTTLRRHVYGVTLDRGRPPTIAELSALTGAPDAEVRGGLRQLAAARVLVLQPASGEILMAPPFSAVPTPFFVTTSRHQSYANCAWDALGVPVMARVAAQISSACGCCGESMQLQTNGGATPNGDGVIHFAVPAQRWWEDLVFT